MKHETSIWRGLPHRHEIPRRIPPSLDDLGRATFSSKDPSVKPRMDAVELSP
jgi:hypothetical protein